MANLNLTTVAIENLKIAIAGLQAGEDKLIHYRTIWALCPTAPDLPQELMVSAAKDALAGKKIFDRILTFLETVESKAFEGDRPDDYHDKNRVQARYASWLRDLMLSWRFRDTKDLRDFLEAEEQSFSDSGEGWMADVAIACQAFVAMCDEIRLARGSKGHYKRLHMDAARQWRESIVYSGFIGWF